MRRLSWHLGFGSDDPEYNEWERQAFRTVVRGCLVGAVFALVFTILAAVWDGHLGWHAVGLGAASGIAIAVTDGRLPPWRRVAIGLALAIAAIVLIRALF